MGKKFLVDINPNAELPEYELVLCKMTEEPLQVLKNITDFEIKSYFADIDEISFKIPLYRTLNDGTQVRNELYDLVDGNMLVLVNEMKYFMLIKPKVTSNKKTGETYKEIFGYSREYEFSKKQIVDYEGASRKIYDTSNSVDENGLEIGFLNYVEKKTSWRVGYVNADLMLKYRGLNFSKVNMLQAFQDVQKTFGCLFQFDTIDKVINVYEITQLGKNQGLHISDRNFINKITQEINDDNVITKLTLRGQDDVSIQSLNITGKPYLINLGYFKKTKYMSQSLIDALDNYDAYVATKEGMFANYLAQKKTLNETLSTKKIELAELIGQLKVIEANLDTAMSNNQSTTTLKRQQATKIQEINNKQLEIDSVLSQVNSVQNDINSLGNDLDMGRHFTEKQLKELDPFIREDDYIDTNFTEDNLEEFLEEGKKILLDVSYPKMQIPVDVDDFLQLVEGQHFKDKFILGDLINIADSELDIDVEVRLVGYTHNPESKKLSLVFSNRNSVDDANIQLKDMLDSLTTTAGTVDYRKHKWDKGEQADFVINQYVNSALNLAKQQIMKADGQKPLIDERGIWLVKENPDGSIDPAQLRLVNNSIVMTNDNWNTLEWVLSATLGINANVIRGKFGQFAQLDANQITVGNEEIPLLDYIDEELTDTINNLGDVINDALSDEKLTNIEANSIKLSLDNVTAESTNLISNATSLGITTEKTNYQNALNTLTNNLNSNWLNKEYPLSISPSQRATINNQFKDLETKKTILINKITDERAKKEVDENAVKKGTQYNRVEINATDGVVVKNPSGVIQTQLGYIDSNGDGVKDSYGWRANHSDGTFSAAVGKGFIRKWQYGEAEYLNGIYLLTALVPIEDIHVDKKPPPTRVSLPKSFRGRGSSVEVAIIPQNWHTFLGQVNYRGEILAIADYMEFVVEVTTKNFTVTTPYVEVQCYLYVQEESISDYWDAYNSYYPIGFSLLVVGR